MRVSCVLGQHLSAGKVVWTVQLKKIKSDARVFREKSTMNIYHVQISVCTVLARQLTISHQKPGSFYISP